MKRFTWKIVLCVVPIIVAALVVARAYVSGGFKLGVDLVGGTILIYEVEDPSKLPENYKPDELAASLKRRIDPTDLYNVTIRPVGQTRVEIILPTGGAEAQADERHRQFTAEEVERIKGLIRQVGSLEFRILANARDDEAAIKAAEDWIADPKNKATLDELANEGKPPPPPRTPEGPVFETDKGPFTYSWVELGRQKRTELGLHNGVLEQTWDPARETDPTLFWKQVAEARAQGKAMRVPGLEGDLLYSREVKDLKLPESERDAKKYEYFLLTRDPQRDPVTGEPKAITGKYLVNATASVDDKLRPCVNFRFDTAGGDLFHEVTSNNLPGGSKTSPFYRFLAILLDGKIESAPTINSAIRQDGQISGSFTAKDVEKLVTILRSGALPATLKSQPVSENTMAATLGRDTTVRGTYSVGIAFVVVLVFMMFYYRFAGLVASLALTANLLLTVGVMVAVNATFTLPGLAGLVLTLGMAVDANVLIYERLREERERGASLALAIRNGYDRAFPTIIDTHLSSIFTAIVLYTVGNDQLKGFGISLTLGLIISLFTSLVMTRLMFDIWLAKGWLHKLSMLRFFSRPNIDFMSIRHYWFTATIILTILGVSLFLARGQAGLDIDFMGGTAYGGQLVEPMDITELRDLLATDRQKEVLVVTDVKQLDAEGRSFEITYGDGKVRKVELPNPATAEEVRERASRLPDYSIEQIALSTEPGEAGKSRFFTIRTSDKAPELVQASIDRLLGDLQKSVKLESFQVNEDNQGAALKFSDFASPAQVSTLLARELRAQGLADQADQFGLTGVGESEEERYREMRLTLTKSVDRNKLAAALETTKAELAARPQPERLENFDSQLAHDTQLRALYAILASWCAILLYLWFRFGNWTFGLAAVLCLIHDLCFTIGVIAVCHYVHEGVPGLASMLGIQDFKINLPAVAALLTLVGYSVNDTIVVFDRIREVRGKNPLLTPQMINDSVNQTLSRTLLASLTTWLVVIVLYLFGGEGVHLFAFVMVVGVIVGTYSSIYIASPLLLIFGEGAPSQPVRERPTQTRAEGAMV